ncbi:PREDICTED: uncharacterized protein LOC106809974 [Priapulus caudatus]|uniref:Uncharacterized protein LOC106809974 n=1 Tax=Priapulus caudatus TaxID=37621 RepID=A0ABM1E929_PRICU|nr:PREDICTED: uncharacterized protein LOC106809974 [Priapulus caudatus]
MATLREPTHGTVSRALADAGYTSVFMGLVYSPEYYFNSVVEGEFATPEELAERLVGVWQAVFRTQNVRVFLEPEGLRIPAGRDAVDAVYFLSVNGQFLHQNTVRDSVWTRAVQLLRNDDGVHEVTLPHSVSVGLSLNRSPHDRRKVQEAIVRAWNQANPDKSIVINGVQYVGVQTGNLPATIIRYQVQYNTTDLQGPAVTPAEITIVRYIRLVVGGFGCRPDVCSSRKLYTMYARTNDGTVLRAGAISNGNFIQAMQPAWESSNPEQLRALPWIIKLDNISSGYIDALGRPVSAFFYELALPEDATDDSLAEPTAGQVAPRVRNLLGLIRVDEAEVYGPPHYFATTLRGRPDAAVARGQLAAAWAQAYREQQRNPDVKVFVVMTHRRTVGGAPGTQAIYFLSVDGRIMQPPLSLLARVNAIMRGEELERGRREETQSASVAVPGVLARSRVDQPDLEEALRSAWEEVNAGENFCFGGNFCVKHTLFYMRTKRLQQTRWSAWDQAYRDRLSPRVRVYLVNTESARTSDRRPATAATYFLSCRCDGIVRPFLASYSQARYEIS